MQDHEAADDRPAVKPGRSHHGCGCLLAAALVLVPLGYAASVGPAAWLLDHEYLSAEIFFIPYGPLYLLANQWQTTKDALNWYVDWWAPGMLFEVAQ